VKLSFARWLLAALALAFSARAQTIEYLILVDRSAAMAAREPATLRTLEDFIRTGFRERIRPGEHFAVWFFDNGVNTNSPPLTWNPAQLDTLVTAANLLFRIDSKPSSTTPLANYLNGPNRKMTVVLTDGHRPWSGTIFESAINAAFNAQREAFDRAAKPFLIMLVPRDDQWFSFSIHTNLAGFIELPAPAPEKKMVAVAPKPEPKKEPAPKLEPVQKEPTPPPVELPKPVRVEKPIETVVVAPPPLRPPAVVIETKIEPAAESISESKPEPTPEPVSIPKPAPVAAAMVPPKEFPWLVLGGGIVAIAVAGGFVYTRLQRRAARKSASLISQSLGPTPTRRQKR
jgi:hypothetical protein